MNKWIGKFQDEDNETHYVSINIHWYPLDIRQQKGCVLFESETACDTEIMDAIQEGKMESILSVNDLRRLCELQDAEITTTEMLDEAKEILKALDTLNGTMWADRLSQEANKEIIDKYDLSDKDVITLQDEYGQLQIDPDNIYDIYDDYEELGRHEADEAGYDEWLESYIDFYQIGRDYADSDCYIELEDGRILNVEC